ncbi:MAG: hypothetical protein JRJ84_16920, partial [Deltaproteobacteria bacterium]|nr:hypothetical protein [Deltaproteobacteria bacterium]
MARFRLGGLFRVVSQWLLASVGGGACAGTHAADRPPDRVEEVGDAWSIVWTRVMDIDHGDGVPRGTEWIVVVLKPDGWWETRTDVAYPTLATPPAEWGGGPAPHPLSTSVLMRPAARRVEQGFLAPIEAILPKLEKVSGTYQWSETVDDEGGYTETMHVTFGDRRAWFAFEQGPDFPPPPEVVAELYEAVTDNPLPSMAAQAVPTEGAAPLTLSSRLLGDAVVIAEAPLWIQTTVTNTSGASITLGDTSVDRLEYEVRSLDDGGVRWFSEGRFEASTHGEVF